MSHNYVDSLRSIERDFPQASLKDILQSYKTYLPNPPYWYFKNSIFAFPREC